VTSNPPTIGHCISRDGTSIGYRQMGAGLGLVLLHGGLQTSLSFTGLGAELADTFTVYIPDRRGRGLSGPFGDSYGMQKEVEDLGALLEKTGTQNVFGLSSGAIITLHAALTLPAIRKIALYEPPLEFEGGPPPLPWISRYEKEVAAGNLAAAMVCIIKGTGDRELMTRMPSFLLTPLFNLALRSQAKTAEAGYALQTLVPTFRYDARLVAETAGSLARFKAVRAETLLLSGTRSADFLRAIFKALIDAFPDWQHVEFPGLGHVAADNGSQPGRVAAELRRYFSL